MSLAAHAQPLEDADRCRIARVAPRRHPVLGPGPEQVAEQLPGALSRVAAALELRAEREADFGQTRIGGIRPRRAVTDQLAGIAQDHRELEPLAGGIRMLAEQL